MVIKATGPNKIPCMGPKTGPVPAMFSRLINEFFHFFIATKSTPSALVIAGVSLSSGPKTFSQYEPYK